MLENCIIIAMIAGFVQLGIVVLVVNKPNASVLNFTSLVFAFAPVLIFFIFMGQAQKLDSRVDSPREYGKLIGRYVGLVSFDKGQVQGKSNRISGKIILCNEDGTIYERSTHLTIPKELQSHGNSDVKEIVFIRKQHVVIGDYRGRDVSVYAEGKFSPAERVILSVCVIDVASAKLIAVDSITSDPPPFIIYPRPSSALSGDERADELLSAWIANGTRNLQTEVMIPLNDVSIPHPSGHPGR